MHGQGVHELSAETNNAPIPATPNHATEERESSKPSIFSRAPVVLALISLFTFVAYLPVLFNFFAGDDYVHLTWLATAINHLELVWRNFYTSWLDGTTTKFYRPLISVFMISDYAIWGVNGLGFRLTNIAFHLTSTVFIFLIVDRLQNVETRTKPTALKPASQFPLWATSAAALFALHPLHPEAVAWITGRVDSVVTAFCVASIFFYIDWRQTKRAISITLCVVSMIAGLLSKEMAITLPAAFVWLELLYGHYWSTPGVPTSTPGAPTSTLGAPASSRHRAPLSNGSESNSANDNYGNHHPASNQPASNESTANLDPNKSESGIPLQSPNLVSWIIETGKRCVISTLPFWVVLAAYFGVRYLALGTFVGGYDDSLFFVSNMKAFIGGWIHAIKMLLIPINKSLMGSHHIMSKLWPVGLVALTLTIAGAAASEKIVRRHLLFLTGWLALCLIPVYKLFAIADDLQGSRLAYLATVPLCIMLTIGMAHTTRLSAFAWWRYSRIVVISLVLIMSGFLLYNNNLPWKRAGEETNKIQTELQKLFVHVPGDPQILFLGLPDQIDGAYTCRNALDGMTKKPQLSRDIRNCLMVNAFEPILPFGFIKESIAANSDKILIYRWDENAKEFLQVNIGAMPKREIQSWKGTELQKIISIPEQKEPPTLEWNAKGAVLKSGSKADFVELDLGKELSWITDFVEVKVHLDSPPQAEIATDLLYSNDMYPDFELRRRAHTSFNSQDATLIFALRGLPEWSIGGAIHRFRLLLPSQQKLTIEEISVVPARFVCPLIDFPNSGYLGSKGYLHLGPDHKQENLRINVRDVPGAEGYKVEVTRANLLFEEQNPQKTSKVMWRELTSSNKEGTTVLNYVDFPSPGIYEVRAWALTKDGTICGAGSDHIVISVDPPH